MGGRHGAGWVIDEEVEGKEGADCVKDLRHAGGDDDAFASGCFGRYFCGRKVGVSDAQHVAVPH
jgi:hypothetical protein